MKKIMIIAGIFFMITPTFMMMSMTEDESDTTNETIELVEGQFVPPIALNNEMTERYGRVEGPFGYGSRWHNGIDIGCSYGESLYAVEDAKVSVARFNGLYGNYILLTHGSNLASAYGHLSDYNVVEGQQVRKGDVIGYCGNTGWSSGKHLHFELHIDGERVDPESHFQYKRGSLVTPEGFEG